MALSVGTQAPEFTLRNTSNEPVALSSLVGQKVILAFFPAAFTGVCQAELCSFRDNMARLNAANTTVLAISADLPFANGAFAKANNLDFPILSDWNLDAVNAYDVAFANFAGIDGLTRSERAVFVLDTNHVIQYVEVTDNPGVEPNYEALLGAAEKL